MNQDFNEILSSMLKDLDNGKSVEEIIAAKMAELGLSEESQANVNETVEFVDKIDSASKSLHDAIEHKVSRQEWLKGHVQDMIDELPQDKKDVAKQILDQAANKQIDDLFNEK